MGVGRFNYLLVEYGFKVIFYFLCWVGKYKWCMFIVLILLELFFGVIDLLEKLGRIICFIRE